MVSAFAQDMHEQAPWQGRNPHTVALSGLQKSIGLGGLKTEKMSVLKNVSGVLKPGRATLLLGPPGEQLPELAHLYISSRPGPAVDQLLSEHAQMQTALHSQDKGVPVSADSAACRWRQERAAAAAGWAAQAV